MRYIPVISLFFLLFFLLCFSTRAEDVLGGILRNKIKDIESLVDDAAVVQALNQSNVDHRTITGQKIREMDQRWIRAKPTDDFAKTFINGMMTNACAQHLRKFQTDHNDFKEIFITDVKGLNACQTNKTSDYYQADEDWWTKAYAEGRGYSYYGKIEYDESSRSESISVYVPIFDPESHRIIGICKAVIDLLSLSDDL